MQKNYMHNLYTQHKAASFNLICREPMVWTEMLEIEMGFKKLQATYMTQKPLQHKHNLLL